MMRPEAAEPPEKAAHVKDLNVRDSFGNVKQLWGALRLRDHNVSDSDDISTAQMALLSTHFLSTWGQVGFLCSLPLHAASKACDA